MSLMFWQCACVSESPSVSATPGGELHCTSNFPESLAEQSGVSEWDQEAPARGRGLVSYTADLSQALIGPPLRVGEVWHLLPGNGQNFESATLTLHCNGIKVEPTQGARLSSLALSPFSLVQACRLHSKEADIAAPSLRLFKVSIFQHGSTHFFATQGTEADAMRARWVADISQALRVLTQSLFPGFTLRTDPLPGAAWTATRLLAGYLLLCDDRGVSLVFCELHSHWDQAAQFVCYEDDTCEVQVVSLSIAVHTCVSERVGVDCSCFSFDGYNFSTRSCAEKMLWLRAISNVKVKLRHCTENPTFEELNTYREAIREHTKHALGSESVGPLHERTFTRRALLPRRLPQKAMTNHAGPRGPTIGSAVSAGSRPMGFNFDGPQDTGANLFEGPRGAPVGPPPVAESLVGNATQQGSAEGFELAPREGTENSALPVSASILAGPMLDVPRMPPVLLGMVRGNHPGTTADLPPLLAEASLMQPIDPIAGKDSLAAPVGPPAAATTATPTATATPVEVSVPEAAAATAPVNGDATGGVMASEDAPGPSRKPTGKPKR